MFNPSALRASEAFPQPPGAAQLSDRQIYVTCPARSEEQQLYAATVAFGEKTTTYTCPEHGVVLAVVTRRGSMAEIDLRGESQIRFGRA